MTTKEKKISLGFILFDQETCDFEQFRQFMLADWSIDLSAQMMAKENTAQSKVFEIDGIMLACGFMPSVIPNGEVESVCQYNFFWPEAQEIVNRHQSHLVLAVMDGSMAAKRLFTKAASCWLKTVGALAVYLGSQTLVLPPEMYIQQALSLQENDILPLALWVYIGLYQGEKGASGYTYGLTEFDKPEIEVLNSAHDLLDVYDFLYNIANYVVSCDALLEDGQTIGFSEDEKLPVTYSAGAALKGETIKIDW